MSSQALQSRFQVHQIFKVGKLEKRPPPLQIRDEEHLMNNALQWYANVLILSHYPRKPGRMPGLTTTLRPRETGDGWGGTA